jgi:rare lipoprotein A (peptidoglycan hydrolase)
MKKGRLNMSKKAAADLPGIEGPGVAAVKIAAIDKAAENYITERDKRMAISPKEKAAKTKLLNALHANKEKLGVDSDGVTFYRYEDQIISLSPGIEVLSIKNDKTAAKKKE